MTFEYSKAIFSNDLPELPKEINLLAASGVLLEFDGKVDAKSLHARLAIHDPVVRTWSLTKLLKADQGTKLSTLSMALHVAPRSAYLRQVLSEYLLRTHRFDLYQKLFQLEREQSAKHQDIQAQLLIAQFNNNYKDLVQLYEQMYLFTGNYDFINQAAETARARLNWRDAIKPMLRQMLTNGMPMNSAAVNCLRMFEREGAKNEFKDFASIFMPSKKKENGIVKVYALAQIAIWDKQPEKALEIIEKSKVTSLLKDKASLFFNMKAKCYEETNDYKNAALAYENQNDCLKRENLSLKKFISDLDARSKLNVGDLKKDPNDNFFVMTGFPRSGTTLLENVLASHPMVVTCEETSSLLSTVYAAYKLPTKSDPKCENISARAAQHRNLYYANLKRYVNKKDSAVVIDKTPIISANIKYMKKIFPDKKYIFSIRHPYDVVLSNYKQDYQPNIAMAAFTDIRQACELYNYVMTNWFEVFPGETKLVQYVKYDDLVNNFEPTVKSVLEFLGVPWTDEVTKFAEHSSKRAVRTPSYANVRKGLTIGVQSSWQNFDFIFDQQCKDLLDPWVERFGYKN